MSDRWQTDTWNQHDGWPITTVRCTICNDVRRAFPPLLNMLANWKRDHAAECPYPAPPRCPATMSGPNAVPVHRCILGAGHPVGSEYTWFTDYEGHIWEMP